MRDIDLTTLLTTQNLVLLGGTWVIVSTIRHACRPFFDKGWGARLLPFLPLLIAVCGALIGVCDGVQTIPSEVMLGLIVGFAAGHGFKIGRTSIMGFDIPGADDDTDVESAQKK